MPARERNRFMSGERQEVKKVSCEKLETRGQKGSHKQKPETYIIRKKKCPKGEEARIDAEWKEASDGRSQ